MASAESARSLKEAKVCWPLSAAFHFAGISGSVRFLDYGMLLGPAAEVRLEGKSVSLAPGNVPLLDFQRQWFQRRPCCNVISRTKRIARRVRLDSNA